MNPGRRLALAGAVLVASCGAAGRLAAADRVTFRASDGIALAAQLYVPSVTPAPGVVLVHMLTRSSADWTPLAERLRDAGFLVLALDLRGHGDSGGMIDASSDLSRLLLDVIAGVTYIKNRSEFRSGHLGLAGASLGANLAVQAAASEPGVRSVVLLSPGIDYRGVRCDAAMKKYGDRPSLLVAASNDPYALRSVKELANGAARAQVETLEGAGHGTVMLTRAPDLVGRLVDWFKATLL